MRSLHTDDLGHLSCIAQRYPTYFAHAYFKRYGETGRHYHDNVDIISVITRGEIHHEGSLGDGEVIKSGEVLVQCAGP